ncbi:MFS general substrate transporter [Coniochaeta ligniaria NRRL 30616]|uniref:MFS general substrate transporter n=1 Tax=Coniochaeta ligniaria NRRL 30616 TaxID=1408157 RepID=A0A1J7IYK3_9PEZI|nr:MFS general substrate transporter [Coniochaeta ligniaria NRRL 30616]
MEHKEPGNESDTGVSTANEDSSPVVVIDNPQEDGQPWKPSRDFILAFSSLSTLTLAVAFDATTLSVALPTISQALHGTALEAFWSGTAFLLSSTVLQPSIASLSNIFGRKYVIYWAILLFGAGSLIGALAGNFTVLLVGRTIQGVGGGGIIVLTEVVVTDLTPLQVRGQWYSMISSMWAIGTVFGPLIGSGFSQNITWRWIMYINLPIIGIGLVFVILFLHQAKVPGGINKKLRRFDWVGSFVFTASMTAFLYGVSTGGVANPWGSYKVLLPLLLGPVGLVLFGVYEWKYAEEPIIVRGLFRNWDMIASYIITVFHGLILWSLVYFLTLYYQGAKLYTPVTSALAILPESLTVAPAGMAVGIIAAKTGHYRWSVWAGWVLTTAGAGLLWLLQPHTSVAQWIFINLPIGVGTGMLFPAMALSIQAACEPGFNGHASAFYSFLRGVGQSVGVAISGVIFQNVFRRKLLELPAFAALADEYSRDATNVVGIIKAMPAGGDRSDLIQAYADSLRIIWVTLLAFAAVGMFLGATIKGYTLNQEHITEQGLVGRSAVAAENEAARVEAGRVGEKRVSSG